MIQLLPNAELHFCAAESVFLYNHVQLLHNLKTFKLEKFERNSVRGGCPVDNGHIKCSSFSASNADAKVDLAN